MKSALILGIIILLVLTSCSKLESVGYDMGQNLGLIITGEEKDDSQDIIKELCYAESKVYIPTTVTMLKFGSYWFLENFSFADDYEDKTTSIRYRHGNKDGENINYFYPSNFLENNYVTYTNRRISEDGTIKGNFQFKVSLILKEFDSSSEMLTNSKYGSEVEYQTFFVVGTSYKQCVSP